MAKKSEVKKENKCPLTHAEFAEQAKPLLLSISGKEAIASPKEFSSGSFGWFTNDKFVVMVGDVPVKAQANVILTVVGSKDAP